MVRATLVLYYPGVWSADVRVVCRSCRRGGLATEAVSASLSGDVRARAFWFFLVLGYLVVRWGRETPPESLGGADRGQGAEGRHAGGTQGEDGRAVRDRAVQGGRGRLGGTTGAGRGDLVDVRR